MKRLILICTLLALGALLVLVGGCDKEKIVESTEYIHDIEYVELPPDTIFTTDTVFNDDSTVVYITDTVTITETDYDTVVIVENDYDTVYVTDTVQTVQCDPNAYLANTALQYYGNQIVIEYIYSQFLYDDGWVFYLSTFQLDLQSVSSDVYDIYGYIDYWTPDWSAYYPLEFYWRMTFTGGDPANLNNWEISDPPTASSEGHLPGLKILTSESAAERKLR